MKKYKNALNNIRKEIVAELIAIMKKYNCDEVDTYELDSTPIVIDGATYDEGYTLDSIILMDGTKPYLVFCCSSSYDDDRIDSNNVSIDNLADILEWVKENENDMF